jgi:hypothetical protein
MRPISDMIPISVTYMGLLRRMTRAEAISPPSRCSTARYTEVRGDLPPEFGSPELVELSISISPGTALQRRFVNCLETCSVLRLKSNNNHGVN